MTYASTKYTKPKMMTEVSPSELGIANQSLSDIGGTPPLRVWCSRYFLAQLYAVSNDNPAHYRLSVNRVKYNRQGWLDGITWDELWQVKQECGFGDWYAIEVYPRTVDLMDVANIRHLWLFEEPLPIGWFR